MDFATEQALITAAAEKKEREKDEKQKLVAADLSDEKELRETSLAQCSILKRLGEIQSFKMFCILTRGYNAAQGEFSSSSSSAGGVSHIAARLKLDLVILCQLAAKCRKWWNESCYYIKEVEDELCKGFSSLAWAEGQEPSVVGLRELAGRVTSLFRTFDEASHLACRCPPWSRNLITQLALCTGCIAVQRWGSAEITRRCWYVSRHIGPWPADLSCVSRSHIVFYLAHATERVTRLS